MIDKNLITATEAASMARCSSKTIRRRADEGCLDAYSAGPRTIRIDRESFLAWLWGPDWRIVAGLEARRA